jgi:hypothetical protein
MPTMYALHRKHCNLIPATIIIVFLLRVCNYCVCVRYTYNTYPLLPTVNFVNTYLPKYPPSVNFAWRCRYLLCKYYVHYDEVNFATRKFTSRIYRGVLSNFSLYLSHGQGLTEKRTK